MIVHVTKGKTLPLGQHPISQQVSYNFFAGCVDLFSFHLFEASEKLSFAYENCPDRYLRNKRYSLEPALPQVTNTLSPVSS